MTARSVVRTALLLAAALGPDRACAQRTRVPDQALGPTVSVYSFAPEDAAILQSFDLDGVIPGIAYVGRDLVATAARGTSRARVSGRDSDLEFIDVSLRLRADPSMLARRIGPRVTVSVPILFLTTWRRVTADQGSTTIELFDYSTVGLGSGAALRAAGRRWRFESHLAPSIGWATRGFGNSTGRFTAIEFDAGVRFRPGKIGLSAGYSWGRQRWHVGGPDAIAVPGSGKVDYTGRMHTLRVGIAW